MNEVYTRFFPDSAIARAVAYVPARTVVEVAELPMHALVQIEAVVSHGDGTPPQEVEARHGLIIEANNTPNAPLDPLSTQSVAFSHYNNISGQIGVDPATGALVAGGAAKQAEQALKNIKAIIESVGHTMEDAVKANVWEGPRCLGEDVPPSFLELRPRAAWWGLRPCRWTPSHLMQIGTRSSATQKAPAAGVAGRRGTTRAQT